MGHLYLSKRDCAKQSGSQLTMTPLFESGLTDFESRRARSAQYLGVRSSQYCVIALALIRKRVIMRGHHYCLHNVLAADSG